jgi:hypothetical protein
LAEDVIATSIVRPLFAEALMTATHWQVEVAWIDGNEQRQTSRAWISMDQAKSFQDAIRVCWNWRQIPPVAVVVSVSIKAMAASRKR